MSRDNPPGRWFRAGPCPICGQGVLEVWITRRRRLVLVCDECGTAWFDPADRRDDAAVIPDNRTYALGAGDVIDRAATLEEIVAGGWAGHLEE